jgi:hypothetical protein
MPLDYSGFPASKADVVAASAAASAAGSGIRSALMSGLNSGYASASLAAATAVSAAASAAGSAMVSAINSALASGFALPARLYSSRAVLTRPADASAYAAGDALANHTGTASQLIFSGMARVAGGGGYIDRAVLLCSDSACSASLKLHLYNSGATAVVGDNAAYGVKFGLAANYLGHITFPLTAYNSGAGVASLAQVTALGFAYQAFNGDTRLFGDVEVATGLQGYSSEQFSFLLFADVD